MLRVASVLGRPGRLLHRGLRIELVAELYAVPRIQRPLWVAEQLETALFEGLEHLYRQPSTGSLVSAEHEAESTRIFMLVG